MQSQGLPCYHKRASRHYLNLVDFRLYIFPQYLPKNYFNIIILSLLQSVFFLWGVSINFCINCSAPRCVLHVLLFLSSFVLASLIILVKGMNCESHNYVFFSPLTCYFTSHTCFVFFSRFYLLKQSVFYIVLRSQHLFYTGCMCSLHFSEYTAVISLSHIDTLVFIMETDFVFCEVGAEIRAEFKSLNYQSGQVFAYSLRP